MAVLRVSTSAELSLALKRAASGDVIALAPGTYAPVKIHGSTVGVTITSADPAQRAVLTGLAVTNSANLTFSNLELSNVDPAGKTMFSIRYAANTTFDAVEVHGIAGTAQGRAAASLTLRDSTNVTVTNSEFRDLGAGLNLLNVTGAQVSANYFHELRSDGIHGGGSSDLVIRGNVFTDFRPAAGDHPDAIQLWTANTSAAARAITIANNLITRGSGAAVQGIFLKDEGGTLPYEDVAITGNIVVGMSYRGISVQGGKDVAITGNSVLGFPDRMSWISTENVAAATVADNVATKYLGTDGTAGSNGNVLAASVTDAGQAALGAWLAEREAIAAGGWGALADLHALFGIVVPPPVVLILGSDGADRLTAAPASDSRIEAGAGNDELVGSATHRHELIGGAGDDAYSVRGAGDVVIEEAGGGNDTVHARIDYTLTDHVEVLRLQIAGLTGTGNALANQIWGSAGADTILGMGGNDSVRGGAGDDRIWGGEGIDRIFGDAGHDIVFGGIGADQLFGVDGDDTLWGEAGDDSLDGGTGHDLLDGGEGSDRLSGGAGEDVLRGGDGDDVLFGGAGADAMTGGAGRDIFRYNPADVKDAIAVDTIADFERGVDRIDLQPVDANALTTRNDTFRFIGEAAFGRAAGELRYEVTGGDAYVSGDVNGDGIADFTILVAYTTALSAADFGL